jgi:hypothetical protein
MHSFAIFLICLIGTSLSYASAPLALDINKEGDFCQANLKKFPELKDLVLPAWKLAAREPLNSKMSLEIAQKNPKLQSAMQAPLSELKEISHALNTRYLENIQSTLYVRLAAAQEVGWKIDKYQHDLDLLKNRCQLADISGQNFNSEVAPFQKMISEVKADYQNFHLRPEGREVYLRKLAVAGLEAWRIEKVMKMLLAKAKYGDYGLQVKREVERSLAENARRLIRLHFAFPVLSDLKTAKIQKILNSELDDLYYFQKDEAIYYSHPMLEEWLGLTPVGRRPVTMGIVPFAPLASQERKLHYPRLYEKILNGEAPLSYTLRQRLTEALDTSVDTAIKSASLKCANPTPCGALAVNPDLAVNWIESLGASQRVGPIACACKIGDQRETVPGKLNLGLGLISAGAVVLALIQPEIAILVKAAIWLSVADMAAAGLGIYDGVDNYSRAKQVTLSRSGGSTDERIREITKSENDKANFNLIYDLGTGVVGLLPPARISQAYSRVPLRTIIKDPPFLKGTTLEFTKGATGAPAMELNSDSYSENWDPSRLMVPFPIEMRKAFPKLYANMQLVAAQGRFASYPGKRSRLLAELKLAAEKMTASASQSDIARLNQGEVRADLCESEEAKSLWFVN